MLKRLCLLAALGAMTGAWAADPAYELLQPVVDGTGLPLARSHEGRDYPVVRLADDALRPAFAALFAGGFPRAVLALDQLTRDLAVVTDDPCPELGEATLISLSLEDGGYARTGFWYAEADGRLEFCNLHFVDVTADIETLEDGSLEELIAHEMGHVYLRRLWGDLPPGPSRNFHSAFAITDYVTAFDEGFAAALQPLAEQYSLTPALRAHAWGEAAPNAADLWFSRIDRRTRKDGIRRNIFVHRTMPGEAGAGGAEAFDLRSLRTGQEMLASEGLVGTAIYRLLTSQAMPGTSCTGRPGVPAPLGCRFRKLFTALDAMREHADAPRSPLIVLLETYAELFPDEQGALYRLFIETTFGATLDEGLRQAALTVVRAGAAGDIASFVPGLQDLRTAQSSATGRVVAGVLRLDAAVGPELWLAAPDRLIREAPWSNAPTLPLTVNLNTAGAADLTALGLSADSASALLDARETHGSFGSLADALSRAQLPNAEAGLLSQAQAAFAELPAYERR